MSSDSYPLAGRAPELDRLQLQSRVWESAGRRLLDEIGDGSGARAPGPRPVGTDLHASPVLGPAWYLALDTRRGLIHPSAWKTNSTESTFPFTEFYEVRIYRILRSSLEKLPKVRFMEDVQGLCRWRYAPEV